jgi:hypothetical protein
MAEEKVIVPSLMEFDVPMALLNELKDLKGKFTELELKYNALLAPTEGSGSTSAAGAANEMKTEVLINPLRRSLYKYRMLIHLGCW